MADNLLEIRNLRVNFRMGGKQLFHALKGISFDVPRNSVVALVGESGSGKSVSALTVMDLLPHDNSQVEGGSHILFDGQDLLQQSARQRRALCGSQISMIFQEPMSSLNPVYPVGAQIAEVLQLHKGMSRKAAWARAEQLLNEVGIPEPARRINSYPHELSGGQQQRVMIAMAIACQPKLLIADEPTTALDVTIQKQILELLLSLQRKHGMAILFITHDLALVKEIASHVVVMQHGEIKEQGPAAQVFAAPHHVYTRALLACRPTLDKRPMRLPVVDDFIHGHDKHLPTAERQRGVNPSDPIRAGSQKPEKNLQQPRWPVRQTRAGGGQGCLVQTRQGQNPRHRRRIRLRQNHARQIAAAAVPGAGRSKSALKAATCWRCRSANSCRTRKSCRSSFRTPTPHSTRASPSGRSCWNRC
jgi:peptide/nickel transport system ATP-binding protein